ncbi:MAG: LamG domain-containing protein, partial [Sedimentisphaerales bacterium]|nr:LamG domain-containing protein [Sedimentisphaerales bacterium]
MKATRNLFCIVALVLFCAQVAGAKMVGWWKMDEMAGTTANDSSGNDNHATLMNGATWDQGRHGGAVRLDGNDDYVNLPIQAIMDNLTDSSFCIWVNWVGSGGTWSRIWDFGNGTTFNMFLTPNSGAGNLRFAITVSSWADEDQCNAPSMLPTGWHHVAVTLDGQNHVAKLYLDGEVVAENTALRYTPSSLAPNTQNWLGRSQYAADPYLNGALDDFRIYDVVLDQAGVLRSMSGLGDNPAIAVVVSPANAAADVPRDAELVWSAGIYPGTHDVYLGTAIEDVEAASRANPGSVLVSKGQTATVYKPAVPL